MFWDGGVHQLISSRQVTDSQFHQVSVSYDGTTETVYLDGTSIGSRVQDQVSESVFYYYRLGTGYTPGWPATNGGWYYFYELIDEAALYNRPHSASEVLANFNSGTSGTAALNQAAGGIFGSVLSATATITDLSQTATASLENVSPTLTYYEGNNAAG